MKCTEVLTWFEESLNRETKSDLTKEATAHLKNCKYCRSDCEAILKRKAFNSFNIPLQQSAQNLIKEFNSLAMPAPVFALIETKPLLIGLIVELRETLEKFAENPKEFIADLFRVDPLQKVQRPYWQRSARTAIAVWLFTGLLTALLHQTYGGTSQEFGEGRDLVKIADLSPGFLKLSYYAKLNRGDGGRVLKKKTAPLPKARPLPAPKVAKTSDSPPASLIALQPTASIPFSFGASSNSTYRTFRSSNSGNASAHVNIGLTAADEGRDDSSDDEDYECDPEEKCGYCVSWEYPANRSGILMEPKMLQCGKPIYTEKARRNNIRGTVYVSAIVRKDGAFEIIRINHALGYGLDEEVIKVMKHYKFAPATVDGKPIDMVGNFDFEFGYLLFPRQSPPQSIMHVPTQSQTN